MYQIFNTPLYKYQKSTDQDSKNLSHYRVLIIGAGPVGLSAAIDLAIQGVEVLVLDESDKVSNGSRAICVSKRALEISERLGVGKKMLDKGVIWNLGKVFFDNKKVYEFNLLPEDGHQYPAFINLQQYYVEEYLVLRIRDLQEKGYSIEIRGGNKVEEVINEPDKVTLNINTMDGNYSLSCDWLIACDGPKSTVRSSLGLDFDGQIFEDNFLIADVTMDAEFPTERRFWFDPPFNKGQSALLHKQPDGVWRIDLQLGWDIDKETEKREENVIPRLKAMLGEEVNFKLEWVSIYTFQCMKMEKFKHGRILFAGDSAHQVSPFGARGANSGVQDADNLCWKLKLVLEERAPVSLLDSYNFERVFAAEENIINSSRSTDFITPKSKISMAFRNAVLELSERYDFARPLVNSGRLSTPSTYDNSSLNSLDGMKNPTRSRVGAPCPDLPFNDDYLLNKTGNQFCVLTFNCKITETLEDFFLPVKTIEIKEGDENKDFMRDRFLGQYKEAVYLLRPDQHIAGRWPSYDKEILLEALKKATGN